MINELAKEIHENAKNKGFYEDKKNIGEMLCLIHSEVSEALEADRESKYIQFDGAKLCNEELNDELFKIDFKHRCKNTFEAELADIMIRVMDLAAFKNIDLESVIKAVMRNNSLRPHKHGKAY